MSRQQPPKRRAALVFWASVLILVLSWYGYQRYLGVTPDHYYKVEVSVEVDGQPVSLTAVHACKVYTSRPIGGGATSGSVGDPASVGMRLPDGRGLFLAGPDSCMWEYFQRRDGTTKTVWGNARVLEGYVPLFLADSFEQKDRGEYYWYATSYNSAVSHIRYISGRVSRTNKASYLRWLKDALAQPDQIYVKRGFGFWSLHPYPKQHQVTIAELRDSSLLPPITWAYPEQSCFSLVQVSPEVLSDPEVKAWIAQAPDKNRPVPDELINKMFRTEDGPRRGRILDAFGIIPYHMPEADEYFSRIIPLMLDETRTKLSADYARRGVQYCVLNQQNPILENRQFDFLELDNPIYPSGAFYRAADGQVYRPTTTSFYGV